MKLMVLALIVGLSAVVVRAQEPDRRPPREGDRPEAGQRDDRGPLTAAQKAQVKAILAKYDQSSLTAKDARAINDAFRAAGLRCGVRPFLDGAAGPSEQHDGQQLQRGKSAEEGGNELGDGMGVICSCRTPIAIGCHHRPVDHQ
jgi:hypothetical protein